MFASPLHQLQSGSSLTKRANDAVFDITASSRTRSFDISAKAASIGALAFGVFFAWSFGGSCRGTWPSMMASAVGAFFLWGEASTQSFFLNGSPEKQKKWTPKSLDLYFSLGCGNSGSEYFLF